MKVIQVFSKKQLYLLLWIPDGQKHQRVLRNEIYLSRNNYIKNKQTKNIYNIICLSTLLVCQFVFLFASNKCQNGWADRAQFFCGNSQDSEEGYGLFSLKKFFPELNVDIYYFWKYTNLKFKHKYPEKFNL